MKSKRVRDRRILLTSTASYDPPRGGATRSNLAWLKELQAQGAVVRVVGAAWSEETDRAVDRISIRCVKDIALRAAVLADEIKAFGPDFVLVSSEDLSHRLLNEASRAATGRLVYLAHTPQFFPFGPESWNPDTAATAMIRNAAGTVAIGHHMAAYINGHARIRATVIHPPIYGSPPFPQFGRFGNGSVLMINPCAVKGIGLFLALARRFPRICFRALAGWGTTGVDRALMAGLPNIEVIESVSRIDEVLRDTAVLLMPSLWYEGFGLIAMEAMLRGLPVIASNSGGLKEAKSGTGFVIPVRPITQYLPEFDQVHMPNPVIPEQNLEPWAAALDLLISDPAAYALESARSQSSAAEFVSQISAGALGRFLGSLPAPRPALTSEQKALLVQKLRARQ